MTFRRRPLLAQCISLDLCQLYIWHSPSRPMKADQAWTRGLLDLCCLACPMPRSEFPSSPSPLSPCSIRTLLQSLPKLNLRGGHLVSISVESWLLAVASPCVTLHHSQKICNVTRILVMVTQHYIRFGLLICIGPIFWRILVL